ncbi:MAG TPA: helix-hairpin-helix domain-containing protein [Cyclobacteriaceae bacterium]|nr:helix-hairpin-helix domain-containing protein [Cyclobacteriaceae bacterium]
MRATFGLMLLLILGFPVYCQDNPQPVAIDVQQIIDDIFGSQDLNADYEKLYENLMLLLADPLNLNTAVPEQLRFLGFLSEYQINNFFEYKAEHGDLLTIYELQAVPGFDLVTINRLAPFIKIETKADHINTSLLKRVIQNKNNYALLRYEHLFERKKGFSPSTEPDKMFLGSPDRLYIRYRNSRPGDFSIGLTLEKDAGESFRWQPMKQIGFDFFSFHAQVMNKGKLENLIVGDYQVQSGQGLVLGGLFGMGKGGETITSVRRSNLGGLPYTSSYENGYLRGVLATYRVMKAVHFTAFVSNANRDASLQNDSLENYNVGALQTSGLHRNKTERAGRDAIAETNMGAILNFKNHKVDGGLIWNTIAFNLPFNRKPTPYSQFNFNRRANHNVSLYLNYNFHNFTFFNEAAKSIDGGFAVLSGLLGSITPKFDVAFVYRNYQRNYHTFYANALSESSTIQNESGFYWGWKYKWDKKYSIAGYVDLFRFPWLRYRSYAPSQGYEWLVRLNYQIQRNSLIYFQFREENKSRNVSDDESTRYITAQGLKRNFLLNVEVAANNSLQFKMRAQMSTFNFNNRNTSGFALIQDIKFGIGKLSVVTRYALFETDDYDNRQYVYENDVWLAFALPAYEGKGVRNYLLLSYKFSRHLSAWIRFSHTRYTDRDTIGSGYDLIDGNTKNDVKFQVKIVL